MRRIREAYTRATAALAGRIATTAGPVTRSHLESVLQDLTITRALINVDSLAAIQRGVMQASTASAVDAMTSVAPLAPLAGQAVVRQKYQGLTAAHAVAWLSRVGPDGMQLSDRIWRSSGTWQRDIQHLVEQAIITGQGSRDLAGLLNSAVMPSARTPTSIDVARNLGISPDVSAQALRLARTELAGAARESTIATSRVNPFYRGVRWVVSARIGARSYPVCDICLGLARGGPRGDGVYPRDQEPTMSDTHPNCRCHVEPVTDDIGDINDRLADWINDPTSDPSLNQWFDWMRSPAPTVLPAPAPERGTAPMPPSPPPQAPSTLPVRYTNVRSADDANAFATGVLGFRSSNYQPGDATLANRVNADILEMRRQGMTLPADLNIRDLAPTSPRQIASFDYALDRFNINRKAPMWTEMAARMRNSGRWFSTNEVTHIIRHELAHKAHFDNAPELFRTLFDEQDFAAEAARQGSTTDVLKRRIEQTVSGYAAEKPHELVPEVYAGALAGKTYPDDIMELYRRLGGPPLPRPIP